MRGQWRLVLLAVVLGFLPVSQAWAQDYIPIETYGATPFVYQGHSYVPLRSTAEFLGAALLWDSLEHRAVVAYGDRELALVVGSTTAYYAGQPVALPAPPVFVGGQVLVPATVFGRYLGVPVRWDEGRRWVLVQGPRGWGYYRPAPGPPPRIAPFLRGAGPPPWAPAHGRRRQEGYRAGGYAPVAFVHTGVTYVPLRDLASFVGAVLLWDAGRAVLVHDGREFAVVVGSRTVHHGPRAIALPGPPIIVQDTTFVPVDLARELGLEVRRADRKLHLRGPRGAWELDLSPQPPGRVHGGAVEGGRASAPARPGAAAPPARGRGEPAGRGRGEAAERGRGRGRRG